MRRPPALLRVRVQSDESRFRLWVPLILLWPVIAVILVLAIPLVVLAAALAWRRGWGRPVLFAGPLLLYALTSLPGLRVNVAAGENRVFVSID